MIDMIFIFLLIGSMLEGAKFDSFKN